MLRAWAHGAEGVRVAFVRRGLPSCRTPLQRTSAPAQQQLHRLLPQRQLTHSCLGSLRTRHESLPSRPLGQLDAQRFFYDERKLAVPEPIPVHPFIIEVLNGMGQIVFCKSTLTGVFVTGGLLLVSPKLAAISVLGCAASTGAAKLSGASPSYVQAGLTGYSGALIGCALFAFFPADQLTIAMATIAGSILTTFVASGLGHVMGPLPQLSVAFNLVALAILLIVHPLARPDPNKVNTPARFLDPVDRMEAVFAGISQMCFTNNAFAGLSILVGIFCCSPSAAGLAALGSAIGALTAAFTGVDAYEIEDGIWGYNGAFTALAISYYFVNSGPIFWAIVCSGAFASTLLFSGMKTIGEFLGSPPLTLPYCVTTLGCILLGLRMPGVILTR